jgi:soluble lytic murein transglycosylase-like protein
VQNQARTLTRAAALTLAAALTCAAALVPARARAGTFWARERGDGVVEFTNKTPRPGGKWKVWLKTGPGKASALRGSTDIVPARDTSASRFSRYDRHIRDEEAFYGIPEALLRAIIKTESDYDPAVVSSAGAQGLMQLMPDTARLMGVTDPFDPRQNIMGGARYLQVLARRFCKQVTSAGTVCTPDDKVKIVAAYHAGPGAVEKYGGIPPYETTHAYVAAVMRRYAEASGEGGGAP